MQCLNVVGFTLTACFCRFWNHTLDQIRICNVSPRFIYQFPDFLENFCDVLPFSCRMLVILRQVLWLYCLLYHTKCSRLLYFSAPVSKIPFTWSSYLFVKNQYETITQISSSFIFWVDWEPCLLLKLHNKLIA